MNALLLAAAAAASILYPATVDHVIDGDTVSVRVAGWPQPFTPIGIRIKGIDTPEHELPPAKKPCEVTMGISAMVYGRTLLRPGDAVTLSWKPGDHDKYDRLLAGLRMPDGRDWAAVMLQTGHAVAYGGGTKKPWC